MERREAGRKGHTKLVWGVSVPVWPASGGPEGERLVTAFPSCDRRFSSGSVLAEYCEAARLAAVPASTFGLVDVDGVHFEPASDLERFAAHDVHVLEPVDTIELAAGVQHRLLALSDATLGTPQM